MQLRHLLSVALLFITPTFASGEPAARQELICITNERSGDVTFIDAAKLEVVATVRAGDA